MQRFEFYFNFMLWKGLFMQMKSFMVNWASRPGYIFLQLDLADFGLQKVYTYWQNEELLRILGDNFHGHRSMWYPFSGPHRHHLGTPVSHYQNGEQVPLGVRHHSERPQNCHRPPSLWNRSPLLSCCSHYSWSHGSQIRDDQELERDSW